MRSIESVAAAQRLASRTLPRELFTAIMGGNERGATMDANVSAFSEIGLRPRFAGGDPRQRDLSVKAANLDLSFPVLISPAAVHGVHPGGEIAVARASAAAGTAMGLSNFAAHSLEAVAQANPDTLAQIYWLGGRDEIGARVERARAAGAKGLILTVDWSFARRRDWGSPRMPTSVSLRTMARFAPSLVAKPRWAARMARDRFRIPNLVVPNAPDASGHRRTFAQAYAQFEQTTMPSWADVRWLRDLWGGTFVVKGITNPGDARRAVDAGADVISVSNHGGNNLDGTPATLRLLPGIVDAVGNEVEVFLDGGIRRGSDVVKALALGARATMIGRPWLFGLAAAGEDGVRQVLEILRRGIEEALIGLGHSSIRDISRDDLVIPPGFVL